MAKTDPLIRTKLHPPFLRLDLVDRPSPQERILQGLQGPLTLVTAPAGFGKTTLVASCMAHCGMPFAWLSLDKNDNQLIRFLTYLIAALQEVNEAIGREDAQQSALGQQLLPEIVMTNLINDLDSAGGEIALVLDDYQLISSQAVHEAVEFLLEHCPSAFHLVIATRSDPPFHLSRLRARGHAVELRAADLRFSELEAGKFLNDVMQLSLDASAITALEERTEGWITGLQMAALSIQGREDIAGFIETFSGSNRYILDYLLEEVLASQPPEIQRFLLYTSILDRMSAPLCDALTGGKEGQIILENLEKANLFVSCLDDERTWYRYHKLFSNLLKVRLQQTQPELLFEMRSRAIDWYVSSGLITEAIDHALAGKDWKRAANMIEQQAMTSMVGDSIKTFISWLETIPEEHLSGRPWLYVFRAWSLVLGCQVQGVEDLLIRADQDLGGMDSSEEKGDILGNIDIIRAYLALFEGQIEQVTELASLAESLIPQSDRTIRCDVYWVLGFPPYFHGDLDAAADAWIRARDYSLNADNPYIAVAAMGQLARLYRVQGHLQKAEQQYQQALSFAAERGWQRSRLTSFVSKDLADIYRERNDLARAMDLAQEAVEECERWGNPSDVAKAHAILAKILCAQGQWESSRRTLERAVLLCKTCAMYPGIHSRITACQVRLWLSTGDLTSALRWVEESGLQPDDDVTFGLEIEFISLARILMVQKKMEKAFALLERLDDAARDGRRNGSRIEILVLKSLAQKAGSEPYSALPDLYHALTLAVPEGYVRIFLDEGQPMQQLLTEWVTQAGPDFLRDYAVDLLSQFEAEQHSLSAVKEKPLPAGALIEPLSQRELEVLHLLSLGRTNQQIAHQLVVAPGTVKAHTSNIYRKLDVSNRTEAVACARQLGIIP